MACSKCLNEAHSYEMYAYPDGDQLKKVSLCRVCDVAYNQNLLIEFMKDDFGIFPVSKITRNMINARKDRVLGKGAWQVDGDNKGEPNEK